MKASGLRPGRRGNDNAAKNCLASKTLDVRDNCRDALLGCQPRHVERQGPRQFWIEHGVVATLVDRIGGIGAFEHGCAIGRLDATYKFILVTHQADGDEPRAAACCC